MKKSVNLLIIFLFFICLNCFSETTKFTISEIISKAQKAADPENITANMKTKIQKGIIKMPEQKLTADTTILYSYPDKCKIISKLSTGDEDTQIINGDKAWEIKNGKVRKITGEELKYLIFNTRLDSFRSNWRRIFKKVTLEKNENVNEKECYVIKCTPDDNFGIDTDVIFYIDTKTFLVLRTDMSAFSHAGILREKIIVLNYSNEAGVMIPSKTETDIFGAKIVYNVTDIRFNPEIKNSEFEPQTKSEQ